MAFAAPLIVSIIKQPTPNGKALTAQVEKLMINNMIDYFNFPIEEREIIIEETSKLHQKMKNPKVRKCLEIYRDDLLKLPLASEVVNIKF